MNPSSLMSGKCVRVRLDYIAQLLELLVLINIASLDLLLWDLGRRLEAPCDRAEV